MKKIVTLGELVIRLSTRNFERFEQSKSFDAILGGAEANVAISLANFGYDTYFVSKLPNNYIGQMGINSLNQYGVNTKYIQRGGDRLGVYYSETGASMRPFKIIYDRKHSSISEADINSFDFDEIFSDADWFHFSGIMPALSHNATNLTRKALQYAKKYSVTVSADFNYRETLWDRNTANNIMQELMKYVDVCFDSHNTLLYDNNIDYDYIEFTEDDFKIIFTKLVKKFNFKYVFNSIRSSHSASDNDFRACGYDRDKKKNFMLLQITK